MIKSQRPDLYEYIAELPGNDFAEQCWLFVNNRQTRPVCGTCGNQVEFLDYRRGFREFCSRKCTANSKDIITKKQQTLSEKYGEHHYSKTSEYRKKFEATMMARYGVKNPGQIQDNIQTRARKKQETFYKNLWSAESDFEPAFSFQEYTHVRDHKLPWKCRKCGEVFRSNIFSKIPSCRKCNPTAQFGGQSSVEKEIVDFIRSIYAGNLVENSRNVIPPKEIDIYFPDLKFGIEVNGVYWHSDKFLEKNYHSKKVAQMWENGIRCFMLTDYDWYHKQEVVKKMITHRLGVTGNKIPTRKCKVEIVTASEIKNFYNSNHMGGFAPATHHLAAYYDRKIVAACSLSSKHRFCGSGSEIVRFAVAHNVPGIFGKFLSFVKKNLPDIKTLISYADLRYGQGEVYLKNGFVLDKTTSPGYWYYDGNQEYHRLSWTKKKLVEMGYDATQTEKQIIDDNFGFDRVYDAGHKCYIKEIR